MTREIAQSNLAGGSTVTVRDSAVVTVRGSDLAIDDVVRVARHRAVLRITDDRGVLDRVEASSRFIAQAAEAGEPIYGVTTAFGGMADVVISIEDAAALQNNLPWPHKTGAGQSLSIADTRASMLLRANALLRGVSGIRLEIIRRIEVFLNAGVTPLVYDLGSIGASGDLVPLSYIAAALIGLDKSYKVDFNGEQTDAVTALERLGLPGMSLHAKEGLALINGTSVMAGVAANCVHDMQLLLSLSMGAQALFFQGLRGTNQSFHPFIHLHKPHPGQVWSADQMLRLLAKSQLVRDELDGRHHHRHHDLIQDRYSLRCLPQYMGPIVDGLSTITRQVETEINSATDNPLVDTDNNCTYHGGNFLGQYIGVAMDQLRCYIGLLAKHLDVQIALVVSPEFNNGLPPSLVGNRQRRVNIGLKGLQLTGNSIMPLLSFYGGSLVDRFPTHAEQFNQNINSQGFGSANLTRRSIDIFQQYMAIALMFGIQSIDLRTYLVKGHYDGRACLSPATLPLYEAVCQIIGRTPSPERPYVWNDDEQALDQHIALLVADIASGERLSRAVEDTLLSVKQHSPWS